MVPRIVMRWSSIFYTPAGVFSFHSLAALLGCLRRMSVFCCNPKPQIPVDARCCWATMMSLQSTRSAIFFAGNPELSIKSQSMVAADCV